MSRKRRSLAKLTRPRTYDACARARLFARLDACADRPVVWIAGSPGSGKTTLAVTWLETRELFSGIWYQLDRDDSDPATFFYFVREAALGAGLSKHASLPLVTAEYLGDLPGFARRWFRELFFHLPPHAIVTLDNYQEIAPDSPLHRALAEACEEIPAGSQLLVLSWSEAPAEYSRLAVRGHIASIAGEELRLSIEETRELDVDLDEAVLRDLHANCDGWAAGFRLMLDRYRRTGMSNRVDNAEGMQVVFDYFMSQIFRDATPKDRETLVRCSFLPRFTVPMAMEISGNPRAGDVLEWLHRNHLFVDRRYGESMTYEYHSLFSTFLHSEAGQFYAAQGLAELNARAASILADAGHDDEAIGLYLRARDWPAAASLIQRLAPTLAAAGRGGTILNWVAALPEALVDEVPWLGYWVGMALLSINVDDAYSRFERAYGRFATEGDRTGQLLASAGCLETVVVKFTNFNQGLPWLTALEPLVEAAVPYPTIEAEAYVLGSILAFTSWAAPLHEINRRCADRLFELLHEPIESNRKILAASRLITHLGMRGDLQQGNKVVALLAQPLRNPNLPDYVRTTWDHSLRYVLHYGGDCLRVEELAQELEAVAVENKFGNAQMLFVSAYTVLAEIFLDRNDFEAALSMNERRRRMVGWGELKPITVALVEARVAAARGDFHAARRLVDEALRDGQARGFALAGGIFNCCFPAVWVAVGDLDRAEALVSDSLQRMRERPLRAVESGLKLIQARIDDLRGRKQASLDMLRAALARMREAGIGAILRTGGIAAWAFRTALENDIETEHVKRMIRSMGIPAEATADARWPWRVKVWAMGEFSVRVDDKALHFSAKAPRKLLELLQAIIAFGQGVSTETLCNALWPDAEADAADISLRVSLSRLRKLLGEEDAIRLEDGRLSLNESLCWVDAWALQRLLGEIEAQPKPEQASRLLCLSRGAFLEKEREQSWMLSLRGRLRARVTAAVTKIGDALERQGELNTALELYRRVLDQDVIAEAVYRRQMIVHLALGQKAEALATYRRCREMLSVVLGLKPGPETEAVRRSIS